MQGVNKYRQYVIDVWRSIQVAGLSGAGHGQVCVAGAVVGVQGHEDMKLFLFTFLIVDPVDFR